MRGRLCVLVAALACTAAAEAQTVRGPEQPIESGASADFWIELPADWGVDTLTVDPLGTGAVDTFVRRLKPYPFSCQPGRICFRYSMAIGFVPPGRRTVTFTYARHGRAQTLTGDFTVGTQTLLDWDGDGLPDNWERREGLDATSGAGLNGSVTDNDGDGVLNIDEFHAGTHPMSRYVQYFGDASAGDRQRLTACYSVTAVDGGTPGGNWLQIRLIGDEGRELVVSSGYYSSWSYFCPMDLGAFVADRVLAVEVQSFNPIAIAQERRTQVYLGSTGSVVPSTEWHFAEGPSSRPVDVFFLAYNPGPAPVRATYTYYRSSSEAPRTVVRVLPPGRTTVWVNADERHLAGGDFSTTITADGPIIVNRGLRWHPPGRTAPQESVAAGASALSPRWFFPYVEAAKQSDERLVFANPGDAGTDLDVDLFRTDAEPRRVRVALDARSRVAIRVGDLGVAAVVGVRVASTNGVPFVAEHTQEGAGAVEGRWAVASPGAPSAATDWALATTHPSQASAIVLFNPSDADLTVGVDGNHLSGYFDLEDRTRFPFIVPARRLRIVAVDSLEVPRGRGYGGIRSAIVRSLPDETTGAVEGIVVARTDLAGALDTPAVRVDAFVAAPIR